MFSWCTPHLWLLQSFLPSFVEFPQVLFIFGCEFLYLFQSASGRSLSDYKRIKPLSQELSRIPLESISLTCFFFSFLFIYDCFHARSLVYPVSGSLSGQGQYKNVMQWKFLGIYEADPSQDSLLWRLWSLNWSPSVTWQGFQIWDWDTNRSTKSFTYNLYCLPGILWQWWLWTCGSDQSITGYVLALKPT